MQDTPKDYVGTADHAGLFNRVREALRPGGSRLDRADRVLEVLKPLSLEELESAYQWGDALFRQAIEAFPLRLPIEEHRARLVELRQLWVRPLRWLGGVNRFIERKVSKAPEDAHWRRYQGFYDREKKSRSKARKAWLKANRRSPAQKAAERRYYEKRKAALKAAQEARHDS